MTKPAQVGEQGREVDADRESGAARVHPDEASAQPEVPGQRAPSGLSPEGSDKGVAPSSSGSGPAGTDGDPPTEQISMSEDPPSIFYELYDLQPEWEPPEVEVAPVERVRARPRKRRHWPAALALVGLGLASAAAGAVVGFAAAGSSNENAVLEATVQGNRAGAEAALRDGRSDGTAEGRAEGRQAGKAKGQQEGTDEGTSAGTSLGATEGGRDGHREAGFGSVPRPEPRNGEGKKADGAESGEGPGSGNRGAGSQGAAGQSDGDQAAGGQGARDAETQGESQ